MVSNVVLGAPLRGSILNLQQIERTVADTTLRLSTGLSVNSALDDPQNFFTARALSNEAQDLDRLLDSINQRVFALQEANTGIQSLEQLLEQAEAISLEALEELQTATPEAILAGNVDLRGVDDLTTLNGIFAGQTFDVITGDGEGRTRTATVTIGAGTSGRSLAAQIDNLQDADNNGLNISATLNNEGRLELRSTADDFIRIDADAGTLDFTAISSLGFDNADQFGSITAIAENEIRSQRLFRTSTGGVARYNDVLREGGPAVALIEGENGQQFNRIRAEPSPPTDIYLIGVNGEPQEIFSFFNDGGTVVGEGVSLGQIVERINRTESFEGLIEAEFDRDTGQIVIRPTSDEAVSINFRIFEAGGDNLDTAFGFGTGAADSSRTNGTNSTAEAIVFGSTPTDRIDELEEQLADIQEQIDRLVEDAQYRGSNLLRDEDLETVFNASRTSNLITEGADFSSRGLGITDLTFDNEDDILSTLSDVRSAILDVRSFGTSIANDLGIITARSNFTTQTVNTLLAGSDDLIVADQNSEGANLLALQTRQSIATSTLAFASQLTQQGIVSLIGG